MTSGVEELKGRMAEIDDLQSAAAVLGWDQATYMPPGGGPARGRQMGTLRRISHEKFTDPSIGALLDKAEAEVTGLPADADEVGLVRVIRRDYDRSVRLPGELVSELSRHSAASFAAWREVRPANDFAAVVPHLQESLRLAQKLASYFPEFDHPMDALIDYADEGMTVASVRALFDKLRPELVGLLGAIRAAGPVDDTVLHRGYAADEQMAYSKELVKAVGYDFDRGRADLTPHPFMTKFSLGDVRITTRVNEDDLGDCLFSMLHEAGHALYEQGVDRSFEGTPLADGTSSGVHESQSRLWENVVGRSPAFWSHFYPGLQAHFPAKLGGVARGDFVRAINVVKPSVVRTESDEVTYNLHVMIRFDLELAMLEGRLAPADLPRAWHERYQSDLGVTSGDDRDGVLQDVHWYGGIIGGAFQGYTLGNVMSAQFFEAAVSASPGIPADIAAGRFDQLHGWLLENVYRHGAKFAPLDLLKRATGSDLTLTPYLGYLRNKYGPLYGIDFPAGVPAAAPG